jgi:hypothetical protein
MSRYGAALYTVALSLMLAACGTGSGSVVGSPGVLNPNVSPLRATTITAWDKASGKPISDLLITLSRNSKNGPVIAKGKTGKNGKVSLSGNFTSKDVVCASGDYHFCKRLLI